MKKRILSVCLLTAIMLSAGVNVSAQTAQPRSEYDLCYVNTNGSNLNCRKGPGTEYALVGKFSNGTQLSWSIFGDIYCLFLRQGRFQNLL